MKLIQSLVKDILEEAAKINQNLNYYLLAKWLVTKIQLN